MILSLAPPATMKPIKKQVSVKENIDKAGQKSVESFKVKKKEAIESPISPRTIMSPIMAPTTLPLAPELK